MRSGFLHKELFVDNVSSSSSQSLLNEVWFPTKTDTEAAALGIVSQSLLNEVWFPTHRYSYKYIWVQESQSLLNEVWFPTRTFLGTLQQKQ